MDVRVHEDHIGTSSNSLRVSHPHSESLRGQAINSWKYLQTIWLAKYAPRSIRNFWNSTAKRHAAQFVLFCFTN